MLFLSEFETSTWKVQLSILKATKTFISRLQFPKGRISNSDEEQELISIVDGILNIGYKTLDNNCGYLLTTDSRIKLKDIMKSSSEDGNHQIKDRAFELIKILNELI
ncbi:uncharacterized protein LOC111636910 [Centruroides sculpturatus]|uniref:uncharacterized protein LOC111636910 n=1 Tax=Centruroides sculpturatus TaxID=218467 RepID=UPI000C6CAC25|nr:uncharacterized protein LOC111636910 [Centruroides sculpturatus]